MDMKHVSIAGTWTGILKEGDDAFQAGFKITFLGHAHSRKNVRSFDTHFFRYYSELFATNRT